MTTSNPAAPLPHPATTATGSTRRVVDAPIRMFHWLFALCLVGAYASADSEHWRLLHVTLGYTLAGLLVFRVGYGLLGPRQARLSLLGRKLAGLPAWIASTRPGAGEGPDGRQALNLAMASAIAIAMVMLLAAPVALSGYAVYNDWGGSWLEELHELAGETILWLALAHVGLLAGLSAVRRRNLALPMLTGRVAGVGPDLARRNHGWLAALVLAAVLAFWSWQWLDNPDGVPAGDGYAAIREPAPGRDGSDDDDD